MRKSIWASIERSPSFKARLSKEYALRTAGRKPVRKKKKSSIRGPRATNLTRTQRSRPGRDSTPAHDHESTNPQPKRPEWPSGADGSGAPHGALVLTASSNSTVDFDTMNPRRLLRGWCFAYSLTTYNSQHEEENINTNISLALQILYQHYTSAAQSLG
ncbi:MAG: hypothetical protein HETSPECPRED_000292 [Heterodermia speciosa]|uniref:Uncharacterized protein n=1 Tax=Heterodermia speciosa TaxID=116794 RepID=A0A8H3EQ09_9LECA|nr:MAG: hypothetical protein HETSPECPRED_000292 [Heterodermia speciosa]